MSHPDFLIWMLCYPVFDQAMTIANYRWGRPKKEASDEVLGFVAFIQLIIWFGIGWALW